MKVRIGQHLTCLRCGKAWQARKADVRICPTCKTAYFDVPLKKREAVA